MTAVVVLHTWRDVLPGGSIGVSVFFALSGFLITSLLLDEFTRSGRVSLLRFYVRRCLRLFPALSVVLLAALVFSLTFASPDVATRTRSGIVASLAYVSNWGRALDTTQSYGAVGHTWSLSIEEQFYLAWPVLLIGMLRWRRTTWALMVCLGGIAVLWAWRANLESAAVSPERIYYAFDTRVDGLLGGCAVALARGAGLLRSIPRRVWQTIAAGGLLYIVCFGLFVPSQLAMSWNDYPVQTVILAATVAAVAQSPPSWIRRLLEAKWMVRLGTLSYGVYLWHFVIWTALLPHLSSGPLALVVVASASLLLAGLSFALVERPALLLKRRFAGGSGQAPLAVAPRRALTVVGGSQP